MAQLTVQTGYLWSSYIDNFYFLTVTQRPFKQAKGL